jgi:hypothetical protein
MTAFALDFLSWDEVNLHKSVISLHPPGTNPQAAGKLRQSIGTLSAGQKIPFLSLPFDLNYFTTPRFSLTLLLTTTTTTTITPHRTIC